MAHQDPQIPKYKHTHTRPRGSPAQQLLTWQKDFIFSRTLLTSGITSLPSTKMGVFDRFRRATCSTARSWGRESAREGLHPRAATLPAGHDAVWPQESAQPFIHWTRRP